MPAQNGLGYAGAAHSAIHPDRLIVTAFYVPPC